MKTKRKIVIIGGVAGGASAAARLRRLDEFATIVMVERGPYISFANCGLPYHIGGAIPDREELIIQTPEDFLSRFRVNVLVNTEAVSIDREKKQVRLRSTTNAPATPALFNEVDESYDDLILSPGAEPLRPPLPGIELPGIYVLKNIPDLDKIMHHLTNKKVTNATVIGAGFIGIETAENLVERGISVTIIEKATQVMPLLDVEMAAFLQKELISKKITVRTGIGVTAFSKAAGATEQDFKLDLKLETGETIQTDLVILSIGVRPETKLAKEAGLKIGPQGGIEVDHQMRTSDPHIFAVGDAVEVLDRITGNKGRMALAGPANRQGRLAADAVCGRPISYRGTLGTSIVKVFDVSAASVGLSEKQATRLKIPYLCAWVHGKSHAGYYPGAKPMTLKLLFSPGEGKLLGAQVLGAEGADKRVDVIATAISAGLTVFDLEALDLAYAPPFSSAKDPVNHLGAVAAGMLRGDHPTVRWDQLEEAKKAGDYFLDVRTTKEYSRGTVMHCKNIPVDELREHMDDLPRNRRIMVTCQEGVRGYLAVRILAQHGFNAVNLLGGYKLWSTVHGS